MKRFKKILVLMLVFVMAAAFCACGSNKSGGDSTITVGIAQDIEDSLDPHLATAAGTREVLFNIYEGLVKPNSNGDLIPAVASDYSIDEEGKVYTFTLRDGITFHNGEKVTVEDVKASVERCADTSNGDPLVAAFSNIESVIVVDDKTVSITLAQADTGFLPNLTIAIIPAADIAAGSTTPSGTGPYAFVSRSPQENVVLAKYDKYWGEGAEIANVIFKVIADPNTIVMNLESGAIDMFPRVTADQATQLSDNFAVLEGTMNLVQAVYLNNAIEPLNDIKVRQALCYAVNPQEVMDFVSNGKGTEIGSSMFPSFGKYFMPELNDVYNQDVDKAKALLAEAGYADGFDLKITVPSNYEQHVQTAEVVKEELKAIGVNVNIDLVEWNTWLNDVYIGRQFEATVIGVDASVLSADALLSRFQSEAGNNFVNFNSADYDAAYAKAVSSTDDSQKTEAYKECEKILANEAANIYIQDLPDFTALNKKFTGYEYYPLYAQDISKIKIAK